MNIQKVSLLSHTNSSVNQLLRCSKTQQTFVFVYMKYAFWGNLLFCWKKKKRYQSWNSLLWAIFSPLVLAYSWARGHCITPSPSGLPDIQHVSLTSPGPGTEQPGETTVQWPYLEKTGWFPRGPTINGSDIHLGSCSYWIKWWWRWGKVRECRRELERP